MRFDVFGRPISKPVYDSEKEEVKQQPTPAHRSNVLPASVEKILVNEGGHYDANNKRVINIDPAIEKADTIDLVSSSFKSLYIFAASKLRCYGIGECRR